MTTHGLLWIPRAVTILLALSAAASAQFIPASRFALVSGAGPRSIAVGDFNGDGKLDLAIADDASPNVTVLLGNGGGGFTVAPGSPLTVGGMPTSVAVGDFNGDGKLDLAIAISCCTGTVLLGDGTGRFTAAQGNQVDGRSVAVGDFNGDGRPDLAFSAGTVLLGDGTGWFTAAPDSGTSWASSVGVGDFNGDGNLDLAFSNGTVVLGDGRGGFTPAPGSPFSAGTANGTWPCSVAVGDFNGDGNLDLALPDAQTNNVVVLLGDGTGRFTAAPGSPFSAGRSPVSVVVGDFDGDGKLDLAIANCDSSSVTVLLGNGIGGFSAAPGSPFGVGSGPDAIAVGDFNGDGKPDLAIASYSDNSVIVLLNGSPSPLATLLSPSNGAIGVSLTPTLSWNASSDVLLCEVHFGTYSPLLPLTTLTGGTTYSPGTLTAGTTYYWQVVARNSVGSMSSATWSFVTIGVTAGSPGTPSLSSPANGATGVLVAPTLIWDAASEATSYDVYLGTSSTPPLVTNRTGTSYAPGPLRPDTTYYWRVLARNSVGSSTSATWQFTTAAPAEGLFFEPVAPCRVVDTRNPDGPFGGPTMPAVSARSFAIPQSPCGIPGTAKAYSLNVTVVPEGPLSFLTLSPSGQSQPGVSTLNSWGGIVVANAAIVPAGSGGAVSVYVTNPTDVILDINGYFDTASSANSLSFYAATPCRVVDTRASASTFGGPTIPGEQSREFPIPLSPCGIPATATAYSLNATVVPGGYLGYLTVWPTGAARPNVSTLNSWTGKVVANAAIVPVGNNESISVFVSNPTDVLLDINGYFGQPGGSGALTFYPVTPCRVADTRNAAGPFGSPEMGAGATRSFAIPASGCGIPSTAKAYAINVTVVPDGILSYLTAWPTGSSQPLVSTLNSFDGAVVANAAIVPAGTNGAISVYVTNPTHVILDINGYFAP